MLKLAQNKRVKISGDIELKDRLVGVQRVVKVTKGGRTFGFSAIVVVGDEKSIVGIGLGKSKDVATAIQKAIDAKVHYPVPIYQQPALSYLGLKEGDFPITDAHTKKIITFPCDQHLSKEEMAYVVETVKDFYTN